MPSPQRKPDEESIRRGVELRFRMPRNLYAQVQAAAKADHRSIPNWIMEQLRDVIEVERHNAAIAKGT